MTDNYQFEEPHLFLLINLDKDSKKLEKSLQEARRANIELIRINAVNENSLLEKSAFEFARKVEACWESHLTAYRHLLSTEYRFAVIFEDDFTVESPKKFTKVICDLQKIEFDLIQLGFLSIGMRVRISQMLINTEDLLLRILFRVLRNTQFFRSSFSNRLRVKRIAEAPEGFIPNDFQPGTHAYIISRQLADKILSTHSNFVVPTDGFLQILAQSGGIKSLRVRRSLVGQYQYADSMRLNKERL
jgi:GR25 family glycosyltransferase involved in LPS biosynthesis